MTKHKKYTTEEERIETKRAYIKQYYQAYLDDNFDDEPHIVSIH